jgi:hypothetical protein
VDAAQRWGLQKLSSPNGAVQFQLVLSHIRLGVGVRPLRHRMFDLGKVTESMKLFLSA